MAKRFYITNTAATYTPATKRGAWDDTAATVAVSLSTTKSGASTTTAQSETSGTNNWDVLLWRSISDDAGSIQTAGNLAGTITWVLSGQESSGLANFFTHIHVYVTVGDSDTVRGTVLTDSIGSTEWATSGAPGNGEGAVAISTVAVQPGDRICVCYGYRAANTSSSSFTGTSRYGGSGTDAGIGDGGSSFTFWVEFSDTNGVFEESGTDVNPGAATGTGAANNPTVSTAPLVNVNAGTATGTGQAYNPGITPAYCGPDSRYFVEVDWDNDGNYTDPYDDVSDRLLQRVSIGMEYGRDDARALLPLAAGRLQFELCDPEGIFNDDNTASPLAGDVVPGRPARLRVNDVQAGTDHILFSGFIDDIRSNWNRVYSTAPITVTDGLAAKLQDTEISTAVYWGIKTGDAIEVLLDAIGWPALERRIDQGATTIPWYWEERVSAFVALQRIVASEGPPSLAYIDPSDGYFVFEDRHHRLLRARSQTSQATFCVDYPGCEPPEECPEGSYPYTDPFQFTSTRQNIINHAQFVVEQRQVGDTEVIWETTEPVDLDNDSTILRIDQSSDPFIDAEVEAPYIGSGTLSVMLDRTSGQSVSVTLTGVGQVHVQSVKVWGRLLTAVNTQVIETEDAASIAEFSRSTYKPDAPWISPNDAVSVSEAIVTRWKARSPIIRLRVANCSSEQLAMMMDLVIGDRVTIINRLVNLNDEFIIERIEREITGLGKLHAVTFACEKAFDVDDPANVFRFDTSGHGFNDGLFGH